LLENIQQWLNSNTDNQNLLQEAANNTKRNNHTPIHYLLRVRPPFDLVLKLLLQIAPETLKVQNVDGQFPLHTACEREASLNVITILLDKYPEAAHYKDKHNCTPLHYVVGGYAQYSLVEKLLKIAPDAIKVQNGNGNYPLHIACSFQAPFDVVKMLLDIHPEASEIRDDIVHDNGYLPLHNAIYTGASHAVVKVLLEANPNAAAAIDPIGSLPLHTACDCADPEIIKMLFDAYPKAVEVFNEYGGYLPIHIVCRWNYSEMIPQEDHLKTLDFQLRTLNFLLLEYTDSIALKD
jgi:ankyrin repeat protein